MNLSEFQMIFAYWPAERLISGDFSGDFSGAFNGAFSSTVSEAVSLTFPVGANRPVLQ